MKASWRTSLLGWIALVMAVCSGVTALIDGDPKTSINFNELAAAAAGIGLLAARDNSVSGEKAGAK